MRTVAIVNQKGGCGKTTTAISLAGVYASQGLRVLLVDMDPQSHCAAGLGIPEKRIDLDISDALVPPNGHAIDPARLVWRPSRNLDLIPSRMRLAGLEAPRGGLADREDRHRRLASVLTRIADQYDLCLVDCSPAIGLLTYNALAAANAALIPVETGFFSLQGAARQVSTVRTMARHLSIPLRTWMVATLHDPGSGLAGDLFGELTRRFGDAVCPHTIRRDLRLKEAASIGKTITQYAPDSMGADDYTAVAAWLKPRLYAKPDPAPHAEPEHAEVHDGEDLPINGVVQVVSNVEPAGLAQRLASSTGNSAPAANGVRTDPVSVAEQIAADLRARAATRAEEMARLAQKLAGRGAAATATAEIAQSLTLLAEPKLQVARPPVNLFMGCRQTNSGALFVIPLTMGSTAAVAGDFNGWSPDRHAMKPNNELGVFEVCIPLPPGRYTYRLVIDGKWQIDPFNPTTEPNPFGESNNVLTIEPRAHAMPATSH
ncbi:MAG: hypothetical protein GIKADHBN_01618 [Phycisphaerales bacterium]|nr:hypothetical protein [Phycisphaerales bacterium]